MAKVYFITGSLGAGKTLCGVDMVRRYLSQGRKVATNVNLHMEYLKGPQDKTSRVIRVPDAPSIDDLRAIGYGSDLQDNNTHGLLLLDELGTWFNARDFANKGRNHVIKWCIHMRKRRWDVAFLVQDFSMVDKQMRGNIAQFLVLCKTSKDFWVFKPFPKFHVANVMHMASKSSAENWFYKGKDVYPAYDTEQIFFTTEDDTKEDLALLANEDMSATEAKFKALNGLYCLLPTAYMSDDIKQQSADHFRKLNKGRGRVLMTAAAVVVLSIGVLLWPASDDPVEASEPEPVYPRDDRLPVEQIRTVVHQPGIEDLFTGWRVTGYSQIGDKVRYTFDTPDGQITSDQVSARGYRVRARGPSEAVIVNAAYEYVSVYR